MSKHKAAGKLTQSKRPQPKFLGVKVSDGQFVSSGSILVRQRGMKFAAGKGVSLSKDHSLFSLKNGTVKFGQKLGKKNISVN